MKTFAIGIDLGATTIKAGVVDRKGVIIDRFTADSKSNKGPATVIQQIHFALQELFGNHRQAECMGIGIGSPGVVSVDEQVVKHPPNFADWGEVALGKALRKFYPLPVFVENDANTAAIAEATRGAGREYKDFLFVIWGTGVGGGIIINHKIFRGPQGGAGEIGHITIDYNGPDCNCGSRGCIESYVGQRYLSQRTTELLKNLPADAPQSKIVKLVEGNLSKIDPYIISMAADAGDPTARTVLEEAGELLGYALASALNILDLNIVIIGGGISDAPRFVFKAVESAIGTRVLRTHRSAVRVLKAALGNDAGIIGAASLVL